MLLKLVLDSLTVGAGSVRCHAASLPVVLILIGTCIGHTICLCRETCYWLPVYCISHFLQQTEELASSCLRSLCLSLVLIHVSLSTLLNCRVALPSDGLLHNSPFPDGLLLLRWAMLIFHKLGAMVTHRWERGLLCAGVNVYV